MAFWNKSEDPWDRKPERRQAPADWTAEEKGPEPGLLDRAKGWNEGRKAEKAEGETPPAPIPCPWCGKKMGLRYLWGGVYLSKKKPGVWASGLSPDNWGLCDEGNPFTGSYKTAWFCEDCRKLVVDVPEVMNRYDEYQQQLEETRRRRENGREA